MLKIAPHKRLEVTFLARVRNKILKITMKWNFNCTQCISPKLVLSVVAWPSTSRLQSASSTATCEELLLR